MHRNVHMDHALDQIASDNDTLSKEERRKVLRDNLLLSEGTAARIVATTTLRTKQGAVALGAASVLIAPQMTGVAAASETPAPDVTPMEDAAPDAEAVTVPTVEDVAPVVEDVVPVVEDAAEPVTDVVVEEAAVDVTPPIDIPEDEEDETPLPVPDITPEDEGETEPEPETDEPDPEPDSDEPGSDEPRSDEPASDDPEPGGSTVDPGKETPPEDADTVDDTTPQFGTPQEPVSDVVEEVVEETVPAIVDEVVDEGIVEDVEEASGPVAAPPATPAPPAPPAAPTAPPVPPAPPATPAAPAAPPALTIPARPASSPTTSQRPVTPPPVSSPSSPVEIPSGGSSVDPIEPPTTATTAPEIVRVDPIPSPQEAEALRSRPARPTSNDVRLVLPAIDPRSTPIRQTVVSLDERIRQAQSRPVDTVRVGDWSQAVVDAWTAMQSGQDADDTGVLAFDEIAESPTLGWSYQVQAGDSLWTISEALWGTSDLTSTQISETWQLLYTWNADQIGSNPDLINAGTVIQLPIDTGADA